MEPEICAARLRDLLNHGGLLVREDGGRAFAFKLHQFIGQGRALFATMEAADQREFSLEGQVQASGGRLFTPMKFCRQCGQDYYHVRQLGVRFLPHPVGTESDGDEVSPGYLMLAPADNDWSEERIPEEWRDARGRLRQTWRERVPQALWVAPDGGSFTTPRQGAVKMWWQAAPFSLCLTCGEFYTAREREFGKLASLSSEARSSATTVLATALLRHAGHTETARDKLLSFTDNRQDASLQAGHFNDFVHVSLLRGALYAALEREQELTFDRVARETVLSCGLTIRDIARNAELDPQSPAVQEVWRVFTELTEYRLYEDLRRGWRVVQPNLEHVGLLHLNEFWGLDPDLNELRTANRFVRPGQSPRAAEGFSLNERSTLGRFLRQRLGLTTTDYAPFLEALLALLVRQGLLVRLEPLDDHQFYQLDAACLLWRLGDGSPLPPDPIYSRRTGIAGDASIATPVNAFFQRFYCDPAAAKVVPGYCGGWWKKLMPSLASPEKHSGAATLTCRATISSPTVRQRVMSA